MKKRLLVLLFSLASLALVSCGGGNDVASSGTTAVSAAAPATNTSPASTPSTAATEPKVNGQVDEQTGVAPVAAQMTIVPKPTGSYGCFQGDGGASVMGVVDFGANTMNGTYISGNGLACTYSISFTFSGGPIYHAQGAGNERCSGGNETDKVLRVKEHSIDFDFDFIFTDSGRTLDLQFYTYMIIPSVCQRQ